MIFGLGHLILAMMPADRCLGTKYLEHSFFKTVPMFMLSSIVPGGNGLFAFGDCTPLQDAGIYTTSLYQCVALSGNGDQADGIRNYEVLHPKSFFLGWLDFVWKRSASSLHGDYHNLPTKSFYHDIGVLDIRENWTPESAGAMFKCGPLGGYGLNHFREVKKLQNISVAHDDFDANSFIVFTNGSFTVDTDGYSAKKQSSNLNTILVDGVGQVAPGRGTEGHKYNPCGSKDMSKMAVVTALKTQGNVTYIEGEAAGSYTATKNRPALKMFRRSFIWVGGKYILVLDAIGSERSAEITWLMQGATLKPLVQTEGAYEIVNGKAVCGFQVLSTVQTKAEIVTSTADDRGKILGLKQLQLKAKGDAFRFVSIYNPWQINNLKIWCDALDETHAVVTVRGDGINDVRQWSASSVGWTPSLISANIGGQKFTVTKDDFPPAK